MKYKYSAERNVQILIALLKKYGIKRIVASPGSTNVTFVASVQHDDFFEIYSCVDERSAAYMACGMAAESGEPVVLTCTGATSSREYYPGLTEAFYRKLPVLAVTSIRDEMQVGHLIDQQLDKTVQPKDLVKTSVCLQTIKDDNDVWDCTIKANKAILELFRHGGGPAHIRLTTTYNPDYSLQKLPEVKKIDRIYFDSPFPALPDGRIAIFIGNHVECDKRLTSAIDGFCASHNAAVFCNPCSGYHGNYGVYYTLASFQPTSDVNKMPELMINIGEMSSFLGQVKSSGEVWRVNEDGEIRDKLRKLDKIFEMPEYFFFEKYTSLPISDHSYLETCRNRVISIRDRIPELPFSIVWMAQQTYGKLPSNSIFHLGILSSLRAWSFIDYPEDIQCYCNEGGYGIDGNMSSLVGSSIVLPDKIHLGVVGDLSFFYDINSLRNIHIGNNLRILMVNNGKGNEFRLYNQIASKFGEETNKYISAAGHNGNESLKIVKDFVEQLGFEYITASSKEEFNHFLPHFLSSQPSEKPIVFEVFTKTEDENKALYDICHIEKIRGVRMKSLLKNALGEKNTKALKKGLVKIIQVWGNS